MTSDLVAPTSMTGVQSTDFSRAFPEQEKVSTKVGSRCAYQAWGTTSCFNILLLSSIALIVLTSVFILQARTRTAIPLGLTSKVDFGGNKFRVLFV
jgi:hypothetical protein